MIEDFRAEIMAAGLRLSEIIPDTELQRCPVEGGRPGALDGAYGFHSNEPMSGWWQNWKTGEKGKWTAGRQENLNETECKKLNECIAADKKAREKEQARKWVKAVATAQTMLDKAAPCQGHPYLNSKGVQICPGLKVAVDGRLLVPVLGLDGKLQSLQTITADGSKRFLPGGKIASGFFVISEQKNGSLVVCEGLSTGLSIHEATSFTTLVAFNAGNLKAVSLIARDRYPDRTIIICGDDDSKTEGNPGRTKAIEAARGIDAKLALPVFSGDQVGSDFNDLHQVAGLEVVKSQIETAKKPDAKSASSSKKPVPDWPFRISNDGVFRRLEKENKSTGEIDVEWIYICSRLDVLAETRDANGKSWGRLLQIHTREDQANEWAMPMSLLAGAGEGYRAELLSLGLEIAPGTKIRNHLQEYISTAKPTERARCVDRLGWHGSSFVLPDCTFGGDPDERVLYQTGSHQDHNFNPSGTLEEWQEVAKLAAGNSRLAFAISAAFAAPLLHLAGAESGGFHFRGGSSTGKTTALMVAGSIWGGGGINGYCRNWRATSNGLETVAATHCDTLLCLDEMGQVDGREAGSTAYMLANGQGKTRARRDGTGRPPVQWRVLFLSTGELSLTDKMNEAGAKAKAGQEVRLVDIPADAGADMGMFESLHGYPNAGTLADHLRLKAGQLYGTAAPVYLETITQRAEGLIESVRQARQEFVAQHCPVDADGQVKRVADRFALVAAAGTLATVAKILPWSDDEAQRAAVTCFMAWLDQRGGSGAQEVHAGIEQVKAFIQQHGESRFQAWDSDKEEKIINRAGYVRQLLGNRQYLIFTNTFKKEVCAGLDSKLVARELDRRGLLAEKDKGRYTKTERLPGISGTPRMYVISDAILSEGGSND